MHKLGCNNIIIMNKSLITSLALVLLLAGCTTGSKPQHHLRTPRTAWADTAQSQANDVKPLTAKDFKRAVMDYDLHPDQWAFEGKRPAVVDFYATWCRPCKMMAPVVEQLARKYKGKIDFYKVDIDQEEELASVFGIQSIPTLMFIPIKGDPAVQTGAMPQAELEKAIQALLKQ